MDKKVDTAVLLIGYGGPEKREDIIPFLRCVAKGRPIPEERLKEVAHHYEVVGGRSPINEYTYKQAKKLHNLLNLGGFCVPVYIGMRNWHPFLSETLSRMATDGISRVVGVILVAHRSYISWERYMEDVERASKEAGVTMDISYTDPLYDHPLFVESCADRVMEALKRVPETEIENTRLIFTAHSIPKYMADDSPYVYEFEKSAKLVAERVGHDDWTVAYQSRSGSPSEPWLEPDICDLLEDISSEGVIKNVVVHPLGFLCDHVEVLFDIEMEASQVARDFGLNMYIANTVNDDDKFIEALADLVSKKLKASLGR